MKLRQIPTLLGVTVALSVVANGAVITLDNLDIRSGGVFGHDAGVGTPAAQQGGSGTVQVNGAAPTNANTAANPLDIVVTYSGLNLDGDASANDVVTFTLRLAGTGARTMNQGVDAGFGALNGLTLSMLSVSGTTTDLGDTIVFDGFTQLTVAKGSSTANTGTVDVTGFGESAQGASLVTTGGVFQFVQDAVDFAGPVSSVSFSNTVSDGGTMVARSYDLQFSTVPEPSVALLGALGMLGLFRRRR
ncbi:MAG: PEP-CTERM sorting domain-containing protein [Akkermansiaceae bacterium]|jgi:hypothetical protein|nr:PEP-CTERM sorting domain-containing protein [Akkermansiaceae bacterium]MDP4846780.1 PEP-CTERM sorting domain-containing protein [Akkermansiaceae bacterium]MDP4897117.1 PEP-CTERM sorting domain-containing protein [Akkermansiaceae bacterium]